MTTSYQTVFWSTILCRVLNLWILCRSISTKFNLHSPPWKRKRQFYKPWFLLDWIFFLKTYNILIVAETSHQSCGGWVKISFYRWIRHSWAYLYLNKVIIPMFFPRFNVLISKNAVLTDFFILKKGSISASWVGSILLHLWTLFLKINWNNYVGLT